MSQHRSKPRKIQLLSRREWLLTSLSSLILSTPTSYAQNLTNETKRVIIPFEPGGINDALGRTIAHDLMTLNKQPWIVENVPGAGGLIGLMRVARSTNPFENLLQATAGTFRSLSNDAIPDKNFDPLRELRALAIVGDMPVVCLSGDDNPSINLSDYLKNLQRSKQALIFGTVGIGNTTHVLATSMAHSYSLQSIPVPYRGSAACIRALIGKEIPLAFVDPMAAMPFLQSGKLKCLGLSSKSTYASLKTYQSFTEQGLASEMSLWSGIFASSKIDLNDYRQWVFHLKQITKTKFFANTLSKGYLRPLAFFGDAAQEYVNRDIMLFQEKVKVLGIKIS